ncbi:MAG TPA: hypothetical protein VNL34_00815 [Candidatus Nitrosotenuis sp.]|nr:hypothetical protein [Candidatus Nitrosotenuis sp.]
MLKPIVYFLILILLISPSVFYDASAHRSGCHRWHTCPSDTGSYRYYGDSNYEPKKTAPKYEEKSTKNTKTAQKNESIYDAMEKQKKEFKTKPQPKFEAVCVGTALCVNDTVYRIIDGDTIHTNNYKIRLALTNTPEEGESGYDKARIFTESKCPVGSLILIDQDDKQPTDIHKRIVAKVFCKGKLLNAELLYNHHANILVEYCKTSEFSGETWATDHGCPRTKSTK